VYSPDGVEKMGPLRGDGNTNNSTNWKSQVSREDGSPSWGRKLFLLLFVGIPLSL